VLSLISSLNLAPCEKSDKVETGKANHTLLLSGTFIGGLQVLCKAMVVMSPDHGCLLKLACRSKSGLVNKAIMDSLE